jgi:hypothetical protein
MRNRPLVKLSVACQFVHSDIPSAAALHADGLASRHVNCRAIVPSPKKSAGQRVAGTRQSGCSSSDPYQNTQAGFGKAKLDLKCEKGSDVAR